MKKIGFLSLALLLMGSIAYSQRVKYNFNSEWKLFVGDDSAAIRKDYDDSKWKSVTLPRAWNEDDAFEKDIVDLRTGIAWYRKKFRLPAQARNKKIFIEFEGVRQAADVYVNGHHVGLHENGVTSFGFDVTELVDYFMDNVIAIRTDNSWDYKERSTNTKYQWIDKNFNANYGGIPKNVFLHATPKVYQTLPLFSNLGTTGVYVFAKDIDIKRSQAVITAQSEIKNDGYIAHRVVYEMRVKEVNGKQLAVVTSGAITINPGETKTVNASTLVKGLRFWSWGYGYLYDVETVLKTENDQQDLVTTRTGFRKTDFTNGMLSLNDRVIQVHGYAQRTSNEWPAVGMSVPPWMSDYSNKLIVESNGNLIRWMHITPWKQDVESCDRVGLMQAMPAGDAEKDVEGVRWEQRKSVMRDAIIYNRNNPSIIFYECGNENISEQYMKEMKAIRDKYDPNGGRAIGSREMLDSKEAEYGGEMLYINKSARIPLWATEYSRDEGLRKYWDDYSPPYHKDGDGPLYRNQPAKEYNRNQESHAIEDIARWYDYWKERPGTGKRVSAGGVNIIFSETNTHHRGAENYRRSGEVDALRIPKENFYAHQVMWDGWVDTEKPRIHIIGHWNYSDTTVKDIFVVSSANKVVLSVNDKIIDTGRQSNRFLFTFKNIHWQAGTITATGYDINGKEICRTSKSTADEPAAILLTKIANPNGMKADGHDLVIIQAEVVDKNKQRCPVAMNLLNFELKGPAEWRGGMAQGPSNYILSRSLPVECGVNRVLIRSSTKAGVISVTATADGLTAATLTWQSTPVEVINGLNKKLPVDDLPFNYDRGPTPSTASFTPSRKALTIMKATAGVYADSANASYDDNEMSDWHNDGKLSTAWIEYELDQPAVIDEINLKLNNFRSRSYPLKVSVDGQMVYNDSTARSLGYTLLVCRPVKGKKVRIELVAASQGDASARMTEVTGKKLDDGVARDDVNAKGTLSIIEAEIYERIAN